MKSKFSMIDYFKLLESKFKIVFVKFLEDVIVELVNKLVFIFIFDKIIDINE